MSVFETLSILVPWLALVISLYTFVQQRKLQREANDLQRATSDLAKKQLELLRRDEGERARATLSLVLTGKQGEHLLVLSNVGIAEASDVRIESVGEPSMLVKHQIESMFPLGIFKPGTEIGLGAAIYYESPPKFRVRLRWLDPDQTQRTEDFELVH